MKELIKAQEEYIQFLLNEVRKLSVFASVHGMTCEEETYNKGVELRKNIEEAKKHKRPKLLPNPPKFREIMSGWGI